MLYPKILFWKGRIYNTDALYYQFSLTEPFLNDWEIVQYGYKELKENILNELDGEFAFALFDKSKNIYMAARDPLGIQPLYYAKIENEYYFSSQISDFFALDHFVKRPNLRSMQSMLYSRTVAYSDTMFEGIYRLPPGHYMIIKEGKIQIERYWYPEKIKINYRITEEEAAKKIHELLSKAIKSRVSDLEETAFEVSGGLDSSSIVSILAKSTVHSKIDTYSMDFEGLECDESEYVESILEKYSLHHQKIPTSKLDYKSDYALSHLYTISPHWPVMLTFAMSLPMLEKMKKDGKKIVITGQGGDHLFTGSPYVIYDLFRRFKWMTLYRELRHFPKPYRILKSYLLKPLLGKQILSIMKKLYRKKNEDPFLSENDWIKDLSQRVGITNPIHKNDLDVLTSAFYSTLMDGNLFHCAEEHFGIEFRHPYFDFELVEFVLSLPPEMKYKQKTIKWIFRKAMAGILPDKINSRTDKAEFSEVIRQQIESIDIDILLKDPYIVKLGFIDQSLIDRYKKEYEDETLRYISILWGIINIEYWYRYNFVKDSLSD
ncbi:MAG: hypothetical protein IE885_08280 [Campylobacterales bacterium]|nr:hypothetical protein [Campylobacterales bacterium]